MKAMLYMIQPKNDHSNENDNYHEVLPHENHASNRPIIPVSCESNEPILEWTDNKHYWVVPFQMNFFLVKVFLPDYQLNEIGNILLSITVVNSMILYLLLMVSINGSVHVAFEAQLESPVKTWLL
jgi:hypothetical protein